MKDLLILQDVKNLNSKKGKGSKKSGGEGFADLLFNQTDVKDTKNLLVMQNVFKAKNEIKNKDVKQFSNINLASTLLNEKTSKQEPNLLASLLQNPKTLQDKVSKIVQNAKEMNEFLPKRLQISDAEIMQDIKTSMEDVEYGKELLDDLNFVQILDFLDILKQDKKNVKLNDFFNLKNIVNNKASLESFANTNSVHSLVELAKEHKLGLSNITYEKIKNNEYNEQIFAKPYPKLYEQNFFSHALNKNTKIEENLKNTEIKKPNLESLLSVKSEKIVSNNTNEPIINAEKTLKTGALNELLSKIANDDKKQTKDIKEEAFKIVSKDIETQSPKITPNTIKNDIKDIQIQANKTQIQTQETKENENKILPELNIVEENLQDNLDENSSQTQDNKEKLNLPQNLKVDFLNPNKELSKEQTKLVIDNFTRDFKEEIEKFKAPSHKVSINLNPKELGEVNVTMIARGNNLHINLNSNNANTLNLFIANQQEFKNSLVNMGFTGLAMNFGDKKEGSNHQEQQKARKKYEEIEELESTSDMPSGINAVLYRYF
ncbi:MULTISPECIES: flagellar hook-length control protein FliK [unclassified Campylobacter]|uniref:flagellar hook-length control protein FliK n=1 Tax=unclassified Campylobacter TaxID=2593542 RepID=UPI001D85BB36|nr:flagellar hook-length control protein FliK [Campylobacter sp. RM12642]MBZ7983296.1 flagellar hook-length control protein FliK [Campylobacter sp. RM12647]MBZ7990757.1 flagellar hook-length control protein FliK [Campylobacter sp. RM9331]MBZ7992459.1 flagellar hook-length control protein FliK [Campylobacter sp. RM9333]MBZ8005587.1 flagellar hook-length control protein FliK [Campylobacter sp. RM9332]MBZ8006558.1 flagellar hook-length control protein FliK [Campylobacter sp. RM9334]